MYSLENKVIVVTGATGILGGSFIKAIAENGGKVEGYNSLFRHFLARLRRKTKCYTKAKYMLIHSIKLLMFKWNNDLAILC